MGSAPYLTLPYAPADFTDNFRTSGYCGFTPSGSDNSGLWRLPPVNTSIVTPLRAGSNVTMSWNQHYPHNGGYELDIHRVVNGTLGERLACEKNFGCVDGTQISAVVSLPAGVTCDLCLVRMRRQALEWGGSYLFRSCAFVTITDTVDECQGCSGQGNCIQARRLIFLTYLTCNRTVAAWRYRRHCLHFILSLLLSQGKCQCNRSPETGFWYGNYCEQEDECESDEHCGPFGVCQDSMVHSPLCPCIFYSIAYVDSQMNLPSFVLPSCVTFQVCGSFFVGRHSSTQAMLLQEGLLW